jgi:hypothetical protein
MQPQMTQISQMKTGGEFRALHLRSSASSAVKEEGLP